MTIILLTDVNGKKGIKPASFMVSGNGFEPSEQQVKFISTAWLYKWREVLGDDVLVGPLEFEFIRFSARVPEDTFITNVLLTVRKVYPEQARDHLFLRDEKTQQYLALIAVWSPRDSELMKPILKLVREKEPRDTPGSFAARMIEGLGKHL